MISAPVTVVAALRFEGLDPVDARLLLQRVLDLTHAQLLARLHDPLDEEQRARFVALAARRKSGEPIAYILGEREFYGRTFEVDASVLIPRPETELIVELALARIPSSASCRILDLGAGSGNIAITLALERPRSVVDAVDASPAALRVARANAKRLRANNVRFLEGAWYEPVGDEAYDIVVGNPPYVADSDEHLGAGDLRFEPRMALASGPDGFDALRTIIAGARSRLRAGGWLLLEHGYDQGEAVAQRLAEAGFEARFLARDLAQLPRVSGGRKPAAAGARTGAADTA
jgi:release factor glutamine methyltransferase